MPLDLDMPRRREEEDLDESMELESPMDAEVPAALMEVPDEVLLMEARRRGLLGDAPDAPLDKDFPEDDDLLA